MRRRQISNMHGGYRGSGVTIDWHTTYQPSMIQVDNKPLPPIPPALIEQPTIEPPPTTPPPQPKQISKGGILAIVGLAATTLGTGAYIASNYVSGIIDERNMRRVFPNAREEDEERRGLLDAQRRQDRQDELFRRQNNPVSAGIYFPSLLGGDEEGIDLSEQDQLAPILVNVSRD